MSDHIDTPVGIFELWLAGCIALAVPYLIIGVIVFIAGTPSIPPTGMAIMAITLGFALPTAVGYALFRLPAWLGDKTGLPIEDKTRERMNE